MLDFLGVAARYFLLLTIGFIAGALVFRNNSITGESYAQKFLMYVSMLVIKIVELKDKFITKKEN